jgi:hypothetical protein
MYDCMRTENESELGNQMSGVFRKAHKHAYLCLCMYVYEERERISVTLVTIAAQGCARACACVLYYFAYLSNVYVCLPVPLKHSIAVFST